jgi:hypothetical protein
MLNRIAALMVLVTAAGLLLSPIEIEGRGGGGRGGGGGSRGGGGARGGASGARGGGAYRGGQTINRTPTMSRASSKPAVSRPQQRAVTRPSTSQGRPQQARQTLQQRPSVANRAEGSNQISRYAQSRPVQNTDRQVLAQKAQNFSNARGNQITQNRQFSDRASQRLQQSLPNSNQWFDRNFFDHHNLDLDYMRTGANWWKPAAWATLASWGDWGWSTPYYYDDGGNAYSLTSPEFYAYPSDKINTSTVQSTQTVETTGGDWLPLGVFAVASNLSVLAQTNHFIQLAINRSGEIAGVLYNSLTDTAQDLTGMVDKNSQMAYWLMANRTNAPISSTGVYNLTEDQTPINVHFSDGTDQTWILVRLQQ